MTARDQFLGSKLSLVGITQQDQMLFSCVGYYSAWNVTAKCDETTVVGYGEREEVYVGHMT